MLAAWLHAWGMIEVTSMGTPLPFPLMAVRGRRSPQAHVALLSCLFPEAGCYAVRSAMTSEALAN